MTNPILEPILERILYVEDDPDIQSIAKLALEDLGGFTVEVCLSGREALKLAPEFSPQLMILDVMMPGMDGPTTLAELRKLPTLENVPAIFMTAKVQKQEVADYKALGAVDVIAKPFDPMTLADDIFAVWSEARRA